MRSTCAGTCVGDAGQLWYVRRARPDTCCNRGSKYLCIYLRTYKHTRMHAYMHERMNAYSHTRISLTACVHANIHACTYKNMPAYSVVHKPMQCRHICVHVSSQGQTRGEGGADHLPFSLQKGWQIVCPSLYTRGGRSSGHTPRIPPSGPP